ncbi:hypothetical protein PFISCL1PPCAC_16345, partial [Pristionchus fissidentatus]
AYRPPPPLESNCLYRRSRCLRDSACRLRIVEFDSICGESPSECLAASPSECVHLLWQIKHWLGDDRCDCHPIFGARRDCERFGHLLYAHPCETLLAREPVTIEERNRSDDYGRRRTTRDYSNRRTTRSPSKVSISDLSVATSTQLQEQECDVALHQICLQHVSCSQLWNLFRQNCVVDSDNTCIMTHREACWESFEGLLWTGLGRCHCSSNVSDCHWIRLHTNFNKCIYDISRESGMSFASFTPLPAPVTPPPTRVSFVNFASQSVSSTPAPVTTTVSPSVPYTAPHTVPPTVTPAHYAQSTTQPALIPTITVTRPADPLTQSSQMAVQVGRPIDRWAPTTDYRTLPYPPQTRPIDNRPYDAGYRTPNVQPIPTDQRTDQRSQIRVDYSNQQGGNRYPTNYPSPGYGSQPAAQSPDDRYRQEYPRHDQSRTSGQDYRNPGNNQDYRSSGSTQDYRNPGVSQTGHHQGSQQSRDRDSSSDYNQYSSNYGRSHGQPDRQQEYGRSNQQALGVASTISRPDYGRSDDYRNQQSSSRSNGQAGSVSATQEHGGSRADPRQDYGRSDYRSGQTASDGKSNGQDRNRYPPERQQSTARRIDRLRNEDRAGSAEAPQQLSVVNNQERSRDEYQEGRGSKTERREETLQAKGAEEERRRRKEEEERRKEEGRKEEKRRKEEEREREERRRKEEEERRQMERGEKIRKEETRRREDRRKEEEERRKEGEREGKRREKERQEKYNLTRQSSGALSCHLVPHSSQGV